MPNESQDRFFDQLGAFMGAQQAGSTDYSQPSAVPGSSLEQLAAMFQAPRMREVRFQNNQLEFFDGTGWQAIVAVPAPKAGIRFPLSFSNPIQF